MFVGAPRLPVSLSRAATMSASLMSLPEPPTTASLHAARERLASDGVALSDLQTRIAAAEHDKEPRAAGEGVPEGRSARQPYQCTAQLGETASHGRQ